MKRIANFTTFTASTLTGFALAHTALSPSPDPYPHSLQSHPYVERLLAEGWTLSAHQFGAVPLWHRYSMAVTGLLSGPGRLEARPVSFVRGKEHQTVFLVGEALAAATEAEGVATGAPAAPKSRGVFGKLGSALTHAPPSGSNDPSVGAGDPSVGKGIAVTLFDHNLAHVAFSRRALTKFLDTEFYRPLRPGVVALIAEQTEERRRSATAEGVLYGVEGEELGEAVARGKVLMVRPKWAV